MYLFVLAILLSMILSLQSLTVSGTLTNGELMLNQYGSMQTTTYPNVDLQWTPTKPTEGQDITFTIEFRNPGSSMPKPHIDYTFTISKEGNTVYTVSKHTHPGTDTIKQKLAADGVYKITVTITGIDFKTVTPRSSDFSITVEKPATKEIQQPERKPTITNPISVAKSAIIDQLGNVLTSSDVDVPLGIKAELTNTSSNKVVMSYIVQVKDSEDITVFLTWIEDLPLPPNESAKPAIFWTPSQSGNYSAEVFVWKSISEPLPLSLPVNIPIKVR